MNLAWKKRLRLIIVTAAALYPLSLLVVLGAFRFVGEGWWITGIALYFPRIALGAPLPIIALVLAATKAPWRLWISPVASLALLLLLMGFVLPRPTQRAPDAPTIRVFSYNVEAEYGGADKIAEEIDRYSPDVVFLEEMGAAEPLSSMLRSKYETVETTNQFLLASRYRLVSTTRPDKIPQGGQFRSPRFVKYVLDTPIGQIVFYNVHPISPRESFYAVRGPQGLRHELATGRVFSNNGPASFYANSSVRELQVQAFAEAAARETDPVIIAGDTNLPGLSAMLRRFLSGYQDGFVKAGWGFGYTFPANRYPWMRIDRILATAQLRFVGFEVGRSRVSDHLCVVADLQRAQ